MPFCSALSNHIAVSLATNTWKPCCRFNDTQLFNIQDVTIEEYRSSSYFQKIVNDMNDGWHSGCSKCMQEEQLGKKSYREKLNEGSMQTQFLEFLEISLSKECNLACRMCSPHFSTKWSKLVEANKDLLIFRPDAPNTNLNMEQIFNQIDLKHLNRIKYLGGEPFITKEIGQLFSFLSDNNVIQNITLYIDTNGTLFPDKYISFIEKFKKVVLSISIDGYGSLNEYIRDGKPWSVVKDNSFKWKQYALSNPNIEIVVLTTLQAYNVHDLTNVKNFVEQQLGFYHGVHKLSFPPELSIDCLPLSYLQLIADSTNNSWLTTVKDNNQFNKFKDYTLAMDKATGKSIVNYIPRLAEYLTP